jgi:hypothetical protein
MTKSSWQACVFAEVLFPPGRFLLLNASQLYFFGGHRLSPDRYLNGLGIFFFLISKTPLHIAYIKNRI